MGKSKSKAVKNQKKANKVKKPYNLIMPEAYRRKDLTELYRQAGFKDAESRKLRNILKGFANLDGYMPVKNIWEYLEKREPGQLTKQQFIEFLKIARYEDEGYALLSYDDLHGKPNFSDPMRSELISLLLLPENDNGEYDCTRYDAIKNEFGWLNVYPASERRMIEEYANDEMLRNETNDQLVGLLAYSVFSNLETAHRVVSGIYHNIQKNGFTLNQCLDFVSGFWKIVEESVGKEKALDCLTRFYTQIPCHDLHGASLALYQSTLFQDTDSDKKDSSVQIHRDETILEASRRIYKEFEKYYQMHYDYTPKPDLATVYFFEGQGLTFNR